MALSRSSERFTFLASCGPTRITGWKRNGRRGSEPTRACAGRLPADRVGHDGVFVLYLTQLPNLRLAPLDGALAVETALVRAETGLRTPAAIQVTAARVFGADAIIINDRRWAGRVARPALVMLEEYAEL